MVKTNSFQVRNLLLEFFSNMGCLITRLVVFSIGYHSRQIWSLRRGTYLPLCGIVGLSWPRRCRKCTTVVTLSNPIWHSVDRISRQSVDKCNVSLHNGNLDGIPDNGCLFRMSIRVERRLSLFSSAILEDTCCCPFTVFSSQV